MKELEDDEFERDEILHDDLSYKRRRLVDLEKSVPNSEDHS